MFSPYEELEYLSNFLPDEGEAVLVLREEGELICKPWCRGNLRDGIDDADLYGRLVFANERLNLAGALPLWAGSLGLVWAAITLHGLLGFGWAYWYLVPSLAPLVLYGCFQWIRYRQHRAFRDEILPPLRAEMSRLQITPHALMAGIRQHAELRTLLDELVRWVPAGREAAPHRHLEDTLY